MANLDEVYGFFDRPITRQISSSQDEYSIVDSYDTTCPQCGNSGYAFTNDGGSIGGCLKCNITYKSKVSKKRVKYWKPKNKKSKIDYSKIKYSPLKDEFFRNNIY